MIIIILLLQSIIFTQDQLKTHFNVSNINLKILKLSEEEFIFYGDKGGVLRTYDGCKTWKQQYSGTHSNILKLDKYQDKVFGITTNNEFMISEDKGNLWKVKKLNYDLSDICELDGNLIISTKKDKLIISNDLGKNWIEKTINFQDNIISMYSYNNALLIQSNKYEIYYTINFGDTWEKIILQKPEKMVKKNNKIFFYDNDLISELNDDFTINNFQLDSQIVRMFYPENDYFLITNYETSKGKEGIITYKLDKKNNSLTNISYFYVRGLDKPYYQIMDMEKNNNEYILSNFYKTILKSKNKSNEWELLSNLPSQKRQDPINFYDKSIFYIISNSSNGIHKSENGGITFKPGNDFTIDTIEGNAQPHLINSSFFIGYDSLILTTTNGSGNVFAYKTFDGGNNLLPITGYEFRESKFINKFGDYIYHDKKYPQIKSTAFSNTLYKTSISDFKVDSVFYFDSVFSRTSLVNHKNKIYGIYSRGLSTYDNYSIVFEADSNFTNYKELHKLDFKKDLSNLRMFKFNDSIYFGSFYSNQLNENGSNYYYIKFSNDFTKWERFYDTTISNLSFSEFGDDYIYSLREKILDSLGNETYQYKLVKLKLNQDGKKFDIEYIGDALVANYLTPTIKKDMWLYFSDLNNIWIPIDEEHLVMNVENAEQGSPAIWTFSPVPNPVRDKCKVKIWTPYMHKIAELKIELINIGSGITHHIQNFEINQIDGYHADIEIDFENQATGAYILNFRLDGKSMSETIIIE